MLSCKTLIIDLYCAIVKHTHAQNSQILFAQKHVVTDFIRALYFRKLSLVSPLSAPKKGNYGGKESMHLVRVRVMREVQAGRAGVNEAARTLLSFVLHV